MKLHMMVGNIGSGKSTHVNALTDGLDEYQIIGYDYQGKGLRNAFDQAVKSGVENVIIDMQMADRKTRKPFIDKARAAGYKVVITETTCDPKIAFERITKRTDHPTLPSEEVEDSKFLQILYTFYKNYQKPREHEYDEYTDLSSHNPYMLDLTQKLYDPEKKDDKPYLVVGDIHGCYDEFCEMLQGAAKDCKYSIALGDLVDRGPKVAEVLNLHMNGSIFYSVLGNHDDKFLRYLIGNKVRISHGLQETIDQTKDMNKVELALYLMSLPLIIKVGTNFMFHAGINPNRSIYNQQREMLLMGRRYNPEDHSFQDRPGSKYWHEFIHEPDLVQDRAMLKEHRYSRRFFGHHYHTHFAMGYNTYALDGYCVYGKELRGMLMPERKEIVVPAKEVYCVERKEDMESVHDNLKPYEELVDSGYLRRCKKGDLILYTYTPQTTYDRFWNEYTRTARGLVMDRKTGDVVCNPIPKFFNYGEMPEEDKNLKGSPKIFDKVDGSLIHIFMHDDTLYCTSKGSFESEQAMKAYEMVEKKYPSIRKHLYRNNQTLVCEIVYPENRIVVDYGDEESLTLLTIRCTQEGAEANRDYCQAFCDKVGMQLVKEFDHSLEYMQSHKQFWKGTEIAGIISVYPNGDRRKLKGDDYLRIHKVVTNVSPLSLWESMENGVVQDLELIPEEFRESVESMVVQLEDNYKWVHAEVSQDLLTVMQKVSLTDRRAVGMFIKENGDKIKHPSMIFPSIDEKESKIDSYVMKCIRPDGNKLMDTIFMEEKND